MTSKLFVPQDYLRLYGQSIEDGYVNENGTSVSKILLSIPLLGGGGNCVETKSGVQEKQKEYLKNLNI